MSDCEAIMRGGGSHLQTHISPSNASYLPIEVSGQRGPASTSTPSDLQAGQCKVAPMNARGTPWCVSLSMPSSTVAPLVALSPSLRLYRPILSPSFDCLRCF